MSILRHSIPNPTGEFQQTSPPACSPSYLGHFPNTDSLYCRRNIVICCYLQSWLYNELLRRLSSLLLSIHSRMEWLSDVWRQDYWLPPGVTWADMEQLAHSDRPLPLDLLIALPLSLLFVTLRCLFERYNSPRGARGSELIHIMKKSLLITINALETLMESLFVRLYLWPLLGFNGFNMKM